MRIGASLLKLVVFLVVTGLMAVFLTLTLAQSHGSVNPVGYYAMFSDASYLKPGDEVRVAGIRVGTVDSVDLAPNGTVRVAFQVNRDRPLPDNVRAAIRYKTLVGDRYLRLREGDGAPARTLGAGETIPLAHTTPAVDIDILVGGFRPLFRALTPQQVNQLSGELIAVLQGEGGTIGDLLRTLGSLTAALADRDQVITSLITNLNAALGALDARSERFSELADELQQLASGLAADREPIGRAVTHLGELSGEAAGLLSDVRPDLRAEVADLGTISARLNANQGEVDKVLGGLPLALRLGKQASSYGGFVNFFLCDLRLKLADANGKPISTPWIPSPLRRCDAGPVKEGQR